METSPCCNSVTCHQYATNFCTCHDSTAVVPCTKFCSDHCIRIAAKRASRENLWWFQCGVPTQFSWRSNSRFEELKLYSSHDDVIKWKHFPRNWPFVRWIHRSRWIPQHKGQWRGALMFSLICVWINGWINTREAGDLRRYRGHYDVIIM